MPLTMDNATIGIMAATLYAKGDIEHCVKLAQALADEVERQQALRQQKAIDTQYGGFTSDPRHYPSMLGKSF